MVSYYWLKSIELFGGIGFVASWTRRKKKNALENHPFCDQKASGIVDFAGNRRKNKQLFSEKCRIQASAQREGRVETVFYRLKTHSETEERILWLFGLGVDASALEGVFRVRDATIRTWLCPSGMQGRKLRERFIGELHLVHVQLDELWSNVKDGSQDMWVWVASDVKTKLIPVMQVGDEVRRWRLAWFTN